jgi:hypothetical protein
MCTSSSKCFFPSSHFSVPLFSTRRAHLILFPFFSFMLCRTARFTTPVVKAQTWRSRIKRGPLSLTCEKRYENSVDPRPSFESLYKNYIASEIASISVVMWTGYEETLIITEPTHNYSHTPDQETQPPARRPHAALFPISCGPRNPGIN